MVIGLQSTGESRLLDVLEEKGGELSEFVSSAKGVLVNLIQKHFPAPYVTSKVTNRVIGLFVCLFVCLLLLIQFTMNAELFAMNVTTRVISKMDRISNLPYPINLRGATIQHPL